LLEEGEVGKERWDASGREEVSSTSLLLALARPKIRQRSRKIKSRRDGDTYEKEGIPKIAKLEQD